MNPFNRYYCENCNYLDSWFPGITFSDIDACYEFDLSQKTECRIICITEKENFSKTWDIKFSSWWIELEDKNTEEIQVISLDMKDFRDPMGWLRSFLGSDRDWGFEDEEYETIGVFMTTLWYQILEDRVKKCGLILGAALAGVDLVTGL